LHPNSYKLELLYLLKQLKELPPLRFKPQTSNWVNSTPHPTQFLGTPLASLLLLQSSGSPSLLTSFIEFHYTSLNAEIACKIVPLTVIQTTYLRIASRHTNQVHY